MYSRVYVEITNICNMNCSFCHGHSRELKEMSEDEFKIVLNKLKPYTEYVYYHLMGEPTTHPKLPYFLELAKESGFKSVITTNGTLLGDLGDRIINAGVHKVSISVHSFEEGSEAAYNKYMQNISSFAEKAARAGIIVVLRLWNKGVDNGLNGKVISYLHEHIQGDWADNSRGIRIFDKLFLEFGERFEWPDIDAPIQGDKFFCYGLRDHFGILCDGTVVPCCLDSEGEINLGNIFYDDLNEVLNSKRAKAIYNGFSEQKASEELCKKCGYAQRFV